MAAPAVQILDTTVADTGVTQTVDHSFLGQDKPLRFHADIGSGDTVIIEGRASSGDDWDALHTFTDETPRDIYVSRYFRARRSVDGGSADSTITVQNQYNLPLETHD